MKLFNIGILLLFITYGSYGQVTSSYIPTITPKAPDAAALKFVDVPVSPYTGASSVSVPIFTIKAKGLNIPISVDYHTGGIRLGEEASATGLGWALNAGGMISRTINDKDDLGGMYLTTSVPQKPGDLIGYQPANGPLASNYATLDSTLQHNCPTCSFAENCPTCPIQGDKYIFDFNCSYNVNFTGGTGNFYNPFNYPSSNPYDMEPDTYSYNFLGKSGKFIVLRDEINVVMEKQDNIKIQILQHGPNYSDCVFLVTDENGNKFYFNTKQSCQPAWQSGTTPTSWYLSQIITQQNDTITFNYSGSGYTSVASENTQTYEAFGQSTGLITTTSSGTTYNNVNLSSIDYKDGHIQFFSDSVRTDLSGGYKLDSIRVLSKTTAGLTYLKSDKFYYSYFTASGNGIGYSESGDGPLELERLRLDAIQETSNSGVLQPYSFVYYNPPATFGEKHSYSIDHWGYYNGAGNTQLIPNTTIYYPGNNYRQTPYQFTYSGASRDPSFPNSECFALRKVIYPTGGSSIFNYEANTYDYNKSISKQLEYPQQVLVNVDTILNLPSGSFSGNTASGVIDFSKIFPTIGAGVGGYNATITVTFVSNYSTGWPSADKNTFGKLSFNFNGTTTDISNSGLTCGGPQCSLSYTTAIAQASPVAYTWTATYNSSFIPLADFSEIHVEVSFQGLQTAVQSNPTLKAGGLRIQSIIDSTATGIAKERIWNYHYGSTNQYSNGILMSMPSYARNEMQSNNSGGGESPVLVLFSSSNTQLTSAIGGNIVGYSHVTETTINPSNNADNGKIVYSYINTQDSIISYNGFRMPGIPNMGNNLDGSEISRITYQDISGVYSKVAETDNYYHTANKVLYYSAKYWPSQASVKTGACPGGTGVSDQGIGEFFPSIKSERVLLDSTHNIVYDPADTTKFVTTVSKNFYDNPVHYLLTRSQVTDSKGNIRMNKTTYPQDYIVSGGLTNNSILDSLIGHNMVTENIEKSGILYYASSPATAYVASATESRYKQLSTATRPMVLDKVFKLDIVNPVTNFVPMSISGNTYSQDSRYRQLISFDAYDPLNNIMQYTQLYQPSVAVIWDYRGVSPIAQVKGAVQADIAYTSFEADGTGYWTFSAAGVDSVTTALTGTKSYNLSRGSISKSGLTSTTTYVVSYWTKNTSPLTITGTISGYPVTGATLNGWTYYEHKVTGQTAITLSGTGNIDEVRLYPQAAEMTSYTYNPLIGVSSINDARGGINFYEYDGFQRLLNIKDQYGNIVKNYTYHYQGQ